MAFSSFQPIIEKKLVGSILCRVENPKMVENKEATVCRERHHFPDVAHRRAEPDQLHK